MIVKICGNKQLEDIQMVADAKPDYMGFVINCPSSPRSNSCEEISAKVSVLQVPYVFLFVNEKLETIISMASKFKPFAIQLHGNESALDVKNIKSKNLGVQIWKAIHLPTSDLNMIDNEYKTLINDFIEAGVDLFVLDSSVKNAYGGTGVTCDWALAAQIVQFSSKPILLAGGLNSLNVKEAIQQVKPCGVDVSSGVEKTKGKKNSELVHSFIKNAKA